MGQRTFTVRLRKDEETSYYAARCVELPEAISQGKTEEEAIKNLREALELVLEEYESEAKKEGGKLIPIIVQETADPIGERNHQSLSQGRLRPC